MIRTLLASSLVFVSAWILLPAAPAAAQDQPVASQPTTAPAARTDVMAKVLEVQGDVHHAPLDSTDWKPCQVGDLYPPQTVVRTGIRSGLKLQIGDEEPFTAVVIDSATKTVINEAYKTSDTKRVRLDIGYGQIRAGVAEGGLKSDFTVDSPVATLSKRGTWDFGMFYERGTDRFDVFLLDRGLVEVLNQVTGERRGIVPGELVTQAMRRWASEAQIRRNVAIPDILGQGDIELVFNRLRQDGLGVLDAGGGRTVLIDLSNSMAQQEFAQQLQQRLPTILPGIENRRPREGSFGTGRGDELINFMIDSNNTLAQKGFARPGSYTFRRSALEGWLNNWNKR